MLGPLFIVKHLPHVLIMVFIVHVLKPLLLNLDGSLLLFRFHLSWVEELLGHTILVLGHQPNGNMVLDVPLIDPLEKELLEAGIVLKHNFSKHFLQALVHLDHVVEIDTCSKFLLLMLGGGAEFPVLGCLQMEFN